MASKQKLKADMMAMKEKDLQTRSEQIDKAEERIKAAVEKRGELEKEVLQVYASKFPTAISARKAPTLIARTRFKRVTSFLIGLFPGWYRATKQHPDAGKFSTPPLSLFL